jgi:hypothetical protein
LKNQKEFRFAFKIRNSWFGISRKMIAMGIESTPSQISTQKLMFLITWPNNLSIFSLGYLTFCILFCIITKSWFMNPTHSIFPWVASWNTLIIFDHQIRCEIPASIPNDTRGNKIANVILSSRNRKVISFTIKIQFGLKHFVNLSMWFLQHFPFPSWSFLSSIHSFMHASIHPFIHSSIHPSIHPMIWMDKTCESISERIQRTDDDEE